MSFAQTIKHQLKRLAVEGNALGYFFRFQKTQFWPIERLGRLQERELGFLLTHAYKNVHHYRRVLNDCSLKPQDFKSVGDLVKLPILTKDDIRQNFGEFVACNSQNFWPVPEATGGSTGEPLRFFIDARSAGAGAAALWRGWSYAGYKFGDKVAVLAGISLIPKTENVLRTAAKKVIRRTVVFPAINLRKGLLNAYAKKMIGFKPNFIRGYPSSIYFFADFLKENGIDGISPKAVLTTAEMLFPHQRKLISEVLQCDVLDGYGAFDGGTAAYECREHNGYHMFVEKTVMEFVDDEGNQVAEGEKGRIIATDLLNYAMPFIRYDTGDMGVYSTEECSCGRKLPLMKKILGRTTDTLHFRTGAVLSGLSLIHIIKDFDVKQFQIVQEKDDFLLVRLIKGSTFADKDAEHLHKILSDSIGGTVEIEFEFMDSMPTTEGKKWKFVISRVQTQTR